jgi:RND family efflux transporter MFP subunit
MSFRFSLPKFGRSRCRYVAWMILAAMGGCSAQARENDPAAPPALPPPPTASASATAAPKAELAARAHASAAPSREGGPGPVLELAGDLRPEEAADLSFKIPGQLASVRVRRGERVNKHQTLATLSENEARAQLAQAEASVAQAVAQLELARDSETRAASLVAAHAAPGSQATAVRLQTAIAQAALAQATAARDLANTALANHQLRAPFDGEITRVPDGVGQTVSPGVLLFRLESLDRLILRATVSEADVDRIKIGDEVTIESHGKQVQGKVRLVLRSLEASSRRAPVEVVVPNANRQLIAGSYVRATYKPR